jgi:hypothetical protein
MSENFSPDSNEFFEIIYKEMKYNIHIKKPTMKGILQNCISLLMVFNVISCLSVV